jgi:hypothetical protein
MNHRPALIHVAICVTLGAGAAAISPIKWVAAALLASAALQINGALAVYEDALPGGFENPDGSDSPAFTRGAGAAKYWTKAIAISGCFAALGLWLQFH